MAFYSGFSFSHIGLVLLRFPWVLKHGSALYLQYRISVFQVPSRELIFKLCSIVLRQNVVVRNLLQRWGQPVLWGSGGSWDELTGWSKRACVLQEQPPLLFTLQSELFHKMLYVEMLQI